MVLRHFYIIILILIASISEGQEVSLVTSSAQVTLPVTIGMEAQVTQVSYQEPAYMWVKSLLPGYRKLKFGYSSQSIYSPLVNVIEGGNTHIQITMKVLTPAINWSKILLKPMGLGSLVLQPYIVASGVATDDWFTISIPLSDFSSTINFMQIANIEFPYSADAPAFELAISCIKFTGGTSPFIWFGEAKTDNKHNGNGGSGELVASVIPTMLPPVYPSKVVFTQGEEILGEDQFPPYEYNWVNPEPGSYQVKASLYMSDNQVYQSNPVDLDVLPAPPPPCSVTLNMLPQVDSLQSPASVLLTANVTGMTPPPHDYLLVTNSFTGYRKLKLGYSAASLYAPLNNVLESGNTHMEIVLRDAAGGANWGKIQIRPGGIGTLSILPYVNAAGGVGSEWTTVIIPLADFSPNVSFASLANIEFPYSASAPYFQIAVKSIRFIGGSAPFVWFGYGKTDNKHNGNGGSGELVASLFLGQQSGDHIEKVEFFNSGNKIGEDSDQPFELGMSNLPEGDYSFSAKMISHQGLIVNSQPAPLVVYEPSLPLSTMTVSIQSPLAGSNYLTPLNLPIGFSTTGAIAPAPDYLKVVNTLTGYVKLKLGYSPTSIYNPKQNVIAGGNDSIEIVLKNLGGTIDWNKIRLRPEGIGSLSLGAYVTAVGGVGSDWKTIRIPLTAFDTSIRFSAIGYMEFPFSAGANNFTIAVQSIRFTGGTAPFIWFGYGKVNNAHDGDGGTGHMTATLVSPNNLAVDIKKMMLFDNGALVHVDSTAPFQPVLSNPAPGAHSLQMKITDTRNAVAWSGIVTCNTLNNIPEGDLLITIQFDQTPASLKLEKAPLRYNKDFAYSLSLDDGLTDAYTCAFKLLGGGYSPVTLETYPGLHYTDGCGNSIAFSGSLMWNSVSSSFSDIHINTPSYVTWLQLNEMLGNRWDVVNHSYSHATDPLTTNYSWQITANDSAVFSHTGRHMTHFVIPGGSTVAGYSPIFWNHGIVCNYSRSTTVGYPYGLQIENPLSYNQFTIYRDFKCDDTHNTLNILTGITNCANQSQNGKHLWYNDFTHHVSPVTYGGSMLFPLFRYYMEQVEALYGQPGSDRIWAASGVEVFEYLKLRDSSRVTGSWWNNELKILVDRTNIPQNLLKYAMSFTVDAGTSITSVTTNDPDVNLTYRGNTTRKLLNVDWQPFTFQPSYQVPGNNQPIYAEDQNTDNVLHQVWETQEMVYHLTGSVEGNGVVAIYDVMGNLVWRGNVTTSQSTGVQRINIPKMQAGVYLVKYHDETGQMLTGRFAQPQ